MIELLLGLKPTESNIKLNLEIPVVQVQEEKKEPTTYTIEQGDNLTKIAEKFNTSWQRLWQKNINLTNQDQLDVGVKIVIPAPDEVLADRPLYSIPQPEKTATAARNSSPGNLYTLNNCTWYAKNRRPDLPNNLGDSISWVYNAAAQGFATGSSPRVGAIGQQGMHVVYIEAVNSDGTVYLSEMNYDFNGGFRYRTAPASNFTYIY